MKEEDETFISYSSTHTATLHCAHAQKAKLSFLCCHPIGWMSLTNGAAVARRAGFSVPQAEEVLPAPLALGTICVIPAVGTVATVPSGTV